METGARVARERFGCLRVRVRVFAGVSSQRTARTAKGVRARTSTKVYVGLLEVERETAVRRVFIKFQQRNYLTINHRLLSQFGGSWQCDYGRKGDLDE